MGFKISPAIGLVYVGTDCSTAQPNRLISNLCALSVHGRKTDQAQSSSTWMSERLKEQV